jgi:hypothetical protein
MKSKMKWMGEVMAYQTVHSPSIPIHLQEVFVDPTFLLLHPMNNQVIPFPISPQNLHTLEKRQQHPHKRLSTIHTAQVPQEPSLVPPTSSGTGTVLDFSRIIGFGHVEWVGEGGSRIELK